MQTEQLNFEDRRIEYRFAGAAADGADLVMLHEGLGSVSMWRGFPDPLAQATGCRPLVYSRPRHGGSSPPHAPPGADSMPRKAPPFLPPHLPPPGNRPPRLSPHH